MKPMEVDFGPDEPLPTEPEVRQSIPRTPPHSIEAEEHLLSSIMLDGGDVIPRCRAAGIEPGSFHLPEHGTIYNGLTQLFDLGHSTDLAYLAEHLKEKKKLEEVGGLAFLVAISSRVPTTAQSGFFIDKVKDLHILRESILAHTRAVEEAYAFTGNIREFLSDQQERTTKLLERGLAGEGLTKREFDSKRKVQKPTPIFTLAKTTISTPGNLTTIYAPPKAGKSAFIGGMIAAAMTTPTSGHDTFGIEGPNYAGHALLHFDTEQSLYDWQQLVTSAMRRVGLTEEPKWMRSFHLVGMPARDCRAFIEQKVRWARKTFGGIHSIIIDGIADLVIDPNSPDECFPLITRLHGLAEENHTAVISILHMNPSSDQQANQKGRGHLGSQLERKSESNLTMEKDGDVTKVWGMRQRGKTISKDHAVCYSWSDEHQMHRSCASVGEPPKTKKGDKYKYSDFAVNFPTAMQPHKVLADIYRGIKTISGISDGAFKDLAMQAWKDGYIDRQEVVGRGWGFRRVDHPPK